MQITDLSNTAEAIRFLQHWNPDDAWVLTAIHGDVEKTTETRTFLPHDWKSAGEWISSISGRSNLYFHPNPAMGALRRKATKNDIARMHCIHVDIDPRKGAELFPERERILKMLTKFAPEPSALIDSGGGYQAFWLLEPEPNLVVNGDMTKIKFLERYNRQMELLLGGDNCFNIDRLMRLPGTVNVPDAKKRERGRVPAPATLVSATWKRYRLSEFNPAVDIASADQVNPVRAQVMVSGNVPDVSVEELENWAKTNGKEISQTTLAIIAKGQDPISPRFASRSEALFRVCCDLVRAEVPDDMIMGVITGGNAIAESVRDKRNCEQYAIRQIERAKEEAVEPWLRKLNDKHAVIRNMGGKCRIVTETYDPISRRSSIMRQTFEDFHNGYRNRKIQVGEDSQGRPKFTSAGRYWMDHPLRREYDSLVFAPGKDVPDAYNLWKGFGCDALPGKKHEKFLAHVKANLCADNEEHYEYLMNWVARMVQTPDTPGEIAVVFRGKQGTGKSFFAKTIGSLLGPHYLPVSDSRHLVGNFNGHLRDCLLLFADEAFFAGDKRHEGVLKTLITEPAIVVESKGVDAELSPNYVHLIMASNEDWVVPAALGDRRFFVLEVSDAKRQDSAYFGTIHRELEKEQGREHLLYWLMHRDLSGFEVRVVPKTAALNEQKAWNMSVEEAWWYERLQECYLLAEETEWTPVVHKDALYNSYLLHAQNLRKGYPLNPVTFGKFLKKVCPPGWPKDTKLATGYTASGKHATKYGRAYRFPGVAVLREWWDKELGSLGEWQPLPDEYPEENDPVQLNTPF